MVVIGAHKFGLWVVVWNIRTLGSNLGRPKEAGGELSAGVDSEWEEPR
jgi:hypothetical protein